MNSHHDTDDLTRRLRALVAHHVTDQSRARHLEAMHAELAPSTADRGSHGRPTVSRARRWAQRSLAGLAAAATILAPGAVAAQQALPGDVFYPLKRATEQLRLVVSADAVAQNRVAELSALLDRDTSPATLAAAVAAARDAVADLPADHRLHDQLAALLRRFTEPQPPAGPASSSATPSAEDRPREVDEDPRPGADDNHDTHTDDADRDERDADTVDADDDHEHPDDLPKSSPGDDIDVDAPDDDAASEDEETEEPQEFGGSTDGDLPDGADDHDPDLHESDAEGDEGQSDRESASDDESGSDDEDDGIDD